MEIHRHYGCAPALGSYIWTMGQTVRPMALRSTYLISDPVSLTFEYPFWKSFNPFRCVYNCLLVSNLNLELSHSDWSTQHTSTKTENKYRSKSTSSDKYLYGFPSGFVATMNVDGMYYSWQTVISCSFQHENNTINFFYGDAATAIQHRETVWEEKGSSRSDRTLWRSSIKCCKLKTVSH